MSGLYWSVRRELWENRSVYLAPVGVACIVLVGFFLGLFRLTERIQAAQALGPDEVRAAIELPFVVAAIIIMAAEIVVSIFYSLDAFYGERRDRSVLFWKSMPVSDLTTVLAKASIPILLLPLVAYAATVATQGVMLLVSSVVLPARGVSASILWRDLPFLEVLWINFNHLVVFHGLWCAPLFAWLLLVSARATRVPFLWAVLPPLAIGVIERLAFNSSHFGTLLQVYFFGSDSGTSMPVSHAMTMDMLAIPLGALLLRPAFWAGLLVTAFFLFGAVRLRRSQGVI
jgi:ABC-2 type transport system permease protein